MQTSASPSDARRLKVVVVTPTLECGGAEKYVSLFCNISDQHSIEVSVIVIDNEKPFFKIPDHVPVTDLGIKRVSNSISELRKHLQREQPDIVYSTANHLNLLFAIC